MGFVELLVDGLFGVKVRLGNSESGLSTGLSVAESRASSRLRFRGSNNLTVGGR